MKVTVEFLSLPLVTQALGKKKIDVEFNGSTLSDLSGELSGKVKKFKEVIMGRNGSIDNDIQVYINGKDRINREDIDSRTINNGDTVTFMLLVAGG